MPATFKDLEKQLKELLKKGSPPEFRLDRGELMAFIKEFSSSSITVEQECELIFGYQDTNTGRMNLALVMTSINLSGGLLPVWTLMKSLLSQNLSPDVIATRLALANVGGWTIGITTVETKDDKNTIAYIELLRSLLKKGASPQVITDLLRDHKDDFTAFCSHVVFRHSEACLDIYFTLLRELKALGVDLLESELLLATDSTYPSFGESIVQHKGEPSLLAFVELVTSSFNGTLKSAQKVFEVLAHAFGERKQALVISLGRSIPLSRACLSLLESLLHVGFPVRQLVELLAKQNNSLWTFGIDVALQGDEATVLSYLKFLEKLQMRGVAADELQTLVAVKNKFGNTFGDVLCARFSEGEAFYQDHQTAFGRYQGGRFFNAELLYRYLKLAGKTVSDGQITILKKHKEAIFAHILTLPTEEKTTALEALRDRSSKLGQLYILEDPVWLNKRIDQVLVLMKKTSVTGKSYWDEADSVRPDVSAKLRTSMAKFSPEMRKFLEGQNKLSNTARLRTLRLEPQENWKDAMTADVMDVPVELPKTTEIFDLATLINLPEQKDGKRINPLSRCAFSLSEIIPVAAVQNEIDSAIHAKEAELAVQQTASTATNSTTPQPTAATNSAGFWSAPRAAANTDPRMSIDEIRNLPRTLFFKRNTEDMAHHDCYLKEQLEANQKMPAERRLELLSQELIRLETLRKRIEQIRKDQSPFTTEELGHLHYARARDHASILEALPPMEKRIREFERTVSPLQLLMMSEAEKNQHTGDAYKCVAVYKNLPLTPVEEYFPKSLESYDQTYTKQQQWILSVEIPHLLKSITDKDQLNLLLRKLAVMNPHRAVVNALLDAGANPWHAAESSGMTAIDRAMLEGDFELAKYLSDKAREKAGILPAEPESTPAIGPT